MSILIGLIPALAWGVMPLVVSKAGGKPSNQIFGTTLAAFIIGIGSFIYLHPDISLKVFLLALLSGAMWVIGQTGQYTAYQELGVSRTMPISTGLQLLGTSLIGVFIFGEWPGSTSKIIGFVALGVVIAGIVMTSLKSGGSGGLNKKALLILLVTTIGYLAYSSVPKAVGDAGAEIFFPQTLGMVLAANLYVLFSKQAHIYREAASWKNMAAGVLFGIAALAYIISAQANGIATGFVLSQLSVVISTLGGILILKECKTRFQMIATIIGLILIVGGSITTAFL